MNIALNLLHEYPSLLLLSHACCVSAGYGIHAMQQMLRQYKSSQHVPQDAILAQQWIRARVVKVNDSDNVRVEHLSPLSRLRTLMYGIQQKPDTLNVRLMGIDAPEGAHFGMPAQKFNEEAKLWLTKTLPAGRTVRVRLLRRDQYGRIVGTIVYRPWTVLGINFGFRRNISLEMVKCGWAVVYRQSGAEYDGIQDALEACELRAKQKRIGLWQQKKVVLPHEHKRLYKK
ncbi:hypothetical protein MIR68_000683 [Amoeboaphelidium protococcarum]|nr:hypothetical protein MIR68_000683 [Amoeboaphelidium protococcarum]